MAFNLLLLWKRNNRQSSEVDDQTQQQPKAQLQTPQPPVQIPTTPGSSTGDRRAGARLSFPIVTVAFRTLYDSDRVSEDNPEHGYAYRWPFIKDPEVGDWAIVNRYDETQQTVVVVMLGMHPSNSYPQKDLVELSSLAPKEEVRRVRQQYAADHAAWMDDARHVAGISPKKVVRTVTDRFPTIPPLVSPEDTSDPESAHAHGTRWYRIYHRAKDLGFDQAEVNTYKEIGNSWFKRSQMLVDSGNDTSLGKLIESGALTDPRSRGDITRGERAGYPLNDWLEYARRLARDGQERRALEVLSVIIEDEAESARKERRSPSFAFTERAGIIYRKARDFNSEIAVIEKYLASSQILRRHEDQAARKRLAKASTLQDKQKG